MTTKNFITVTVLGKEYTLQPSYADYRDKHIIYELHYPFKIRIFYDIKYETWDCRCKHTGLLGYGDTAQDCLYRVLIQLQNSYLRKKEIWEPKS